MTFDAILNSCASAHAGSIADSVADERAPVLGLPFKGTSGPDRVHGALRAYPPPGRCLAPQIASPFAVSRSGKLSGLLMPARQAARRCRKEREKEYDTHECILPCSRTPCCTGMCPGRRKNRRPRPDSLRVGGCRPEFRAGFSARMRSASFDALHVQVKNLSAKNTFPPRLPSAAAKMLPVGNARRTTGTPGRAPHGAAAPTTWDVRCPGSAASFTQAAHEKEQRLCACDPTIARGRGRLPG